MASVLLVDDEEGILFALKVLLQSRGHQPILARSAAEALGVVDAADAVVTDFSMPETDGTTSPRPRAGWA